MLVLGLASAASAVTATIEVTASDGDVDNIAIGDTLTLSATADFVTLAFGFRYITDDVSTTPTDLTGTMAAASIHGNLAMNPKDGTGYFVGAGNVLMDSTGDNADGLAAGCMPGIIGNPVPIGEVVFSFPYTVTNDAALEGTWITISYGGASGWLKENVTNIKSTPADTSFYVVPEPMTIALLGLGGLFLRRRR